MHEVETNVAADHIDQRILRETYCFHSRTHYRDNRPLAVMPVPATSLAKEHVQSFQWMEHVFGGQRITTADHSGFSEQLRNPSASVFSNIKILNCDSLMKLLIASFGEATATPPTRPYPSGGAMYGGQVTIYAKKILGLERGVYHFLPRARQLERLEASPEQKIERHLFLGDNKELRNYAFFVLYSSMPTQTIAKYGMRGYRLACVEIGSMYQSLIVQSEKIGLRSRVWGGFADEALSLAMGIDPRVSWPFMCHLVGWEAS